MDSSEHTNDPQHPPLPPLPAPPDDAPANNDIALHVEQLIATDLDERGMRKVLQRTNLTEAERRIVVREVREARAFVDNHHAMRRAGWI